MCIDLHWRIRLYDLYILLGRGLTLPLFSVFMSRVLLNMHISCVLFASNRSTMYRSLTLTKKNTQSLKHWKEWLQQDYKSSTLITVKRHAMVLSFLRANLVDLVYNLLSGVA